MSHESHWEPVIGLEIHAELNTRSKLFSRAPNRFGDEPNSNISTVCTGQPGALPVLNEEAVHKAVLFGCAIHASISKFSKFDRKSYFYPDSPRNFQITQYDEPIIRGGVVLAEVQGVEKTFSVNRVHLEDDAGMLKHFSHFAGVDYNRAGVPLIEIVSEPCIHSSSEAVAYATMVRAILQYIDVCDCNMEEGSLRFDVNISVRPRGEKGLRTKVEIKNLNSFSNMQQAIESEVSRQIRAYEDRPDLPIDQVVMQTTCRFDPELREIVHMRSKEDANDYRYFPEPDLPPIVLTDAYIEEVRNSLPELPLQRERRYIHTLNLSRASAFLLVSDKQLADYFEQALAHCPNARSLCNWMTVEFAGRLKEKGLSLSKSGISPLHVAELVQMIDEGAITGRIAKAVADDMVAKPGVYCRDLVAANPDYQPQSDVAEIEKLVDQVLSEHQTAVEELRSGKKDKVLGFLVGQVMKLSRGKAAPAIVNSLIEQKLRSSK